MIEKKVNFMLIQKREEKKNDNCTRELLNASIRAVEGEGNERKFILSFSSEEPYERWFGNEILDHNEGSADLTRLNEIGCLLFNHNRDKVIGKITRAWLDNNRGNAEVEFDSDEESEIIYQKVKSGTLKGVSVGYMVDLVEEVMANKVSIDGRFQGPSTIVRNWTPFEISIVSVPADPTVGVGREMKKYKKETRSLDYFEKQLQINKNIINLGGKING